MIDIAGVRWLDYESNIFLLLNDVSIIFLKKCIKNLILYWFMSVNILLWFLLLQRYFLVSHIYSILLKNIINFVFK